MTTDNYGQSVYRIDSGDELVSEIQKETIQILNLFLNGGFSKKGLLLFPLCSDINSSVFDKIRNILDNCRVMYYKDNSFRRSVFFTKENKLLPSEDYVAKFLEIIYKDLKDWIVTSDLNSREEEIEFLRFNESDYSNDFLKPVIGLKNYARSKLGDALYSLLVHGSLSTLDYVKGWSDFDTFMILRESYLNHQNLLKLRRKIYKTWKYFYQIDALQHHGHFIITEIDLQFYPNSFIPTVVLENAKPLFGPRKIKVKRRDDKIQALRNLENMCKNIKYYKISNINLFQKKNFYHYVLLFPCLFLQSIGKPTYKRESFERARPYFKYNTWRIIEDISEMRSNWNPNYFEKLYLNTPWNPTLGRYISNKLSYILTKPSKDFQRLVERAEKLYIKGLQIASDLMKYG